MPNNEQKRKTSMTEEQKQDYLKTKAEVERKMKTDPEYRKLWEKRMKDAERFFFDHETE